MSTIIRPDWSAWAVANPKSRAVCGARAFLPDRPDVSPYAASYVDAAITDLARLRDDGTPKPTEAHTIGEKTLPGMSAWLASRGGAP